MRADDSRHGTYAGRIAGCNCRPCKDAAATYIKLWRRRTGRTKMMLVPVPKEGDR